ncbi:TonB-dependent receptor [Mangrovicoccus sp. HB161399]|uniref:TonB-dependent receptor n=1 Tax=Mangrovicoccus sp. HB161399 TaxID=2720392 RepID=UPI0015551C2C|nr:TonB-dependent receptor [Mangrovicoccus sp. HB161399]
MTPIFRKSMLPVACLLAPAASWAQEAAPTVLGPIIVQGERIERSLEDTASSVSVIEAARVEERSGASTVDEAVNTVPNVIFNSTNGAPVIRGQDGQGPNEGSGAFFGGTVPRVPVNVDGHVMTYNELVFGMASLWDVDTIEVYRGPQTSAQGANSIAGAVIVNTNDPSFVPEAAAQLEFGSYNTRRGSVMVSGPLSDSFAARFSYDYQARDTFIDYKNDAFMKGDTDQDFEASTARAKLLWQPEALPQLEVMLTLSQIETSAPSWEAASGKRSTYAKMDNWTNSMPSWEVDTTYGVLDASYEFDGGATLHNQFQWAGIHTERKTAPDTAGSAKIDQDDMSNETRLVFGDEVSALSGVAGVYVSRLSSDEWLNYYPDYYGITTFDDEKESLGIYAETTWRFAGRWSLTGGLRYQRDHITREGTTGLAPEDLDYDETFGAWLPKLSLAYDVTDGVTVGALVSRGYNPGGVSLSFVTGEYLDFDEETSWNYELFTRANLMGGRLMLNGNLFYTEAEDSQRLLPDYRGTLAAGNITVNADEATSYGLEADMAWQATQVLNVSAGLGLMWTEIGEFEDALGNSYEGNEFGSAPSYTVTLGADWQALPRLTLGGQLRHVDGYYSGDTNEPEFEVDDYTLVDLRAGYDLTDAVQVYGYVDNVFDERSPLYMLTDRSVGGTVAKMTAPRVFGLGVKATF